MLDVSRATRLAPGGDRTVARAGANWIFGLDRLDLGRVLFLGAPGAATLGTVAPLAREVMIWEPQARSRRSVAAWLESAELHHVSVAERPQASWQLQELRADLLVLGNGFSSPSRSTLAALRRPEGWLYREVQATPAQANRERIGPRRCLRLAPLLGEAHTLVPLGDQKTWLDLDRQGKHENNPRPWFLARAERVLNRHGLDSLLRYRIGILEGMSTAGPPDYLRQVALQNGRDIDGYRWGLWARGKYRFQNALVYLFDTMAESPDLVVKVSRDASANDRLENEHRALSELRRLAPGLAVHAPEPVFVGRAGKLAAMGARMVKGEPFASRTDGGPMCPSAQQAVEWLTELGRATADPVRPALAARALHDLFERFVVTCRPSAAVQEFLRQQIASVEASPYAVPAVLQHGDPGARSLKVRPDGTVVFLDWEAAELNGMPLWDLFEFLRTHALLGTTRSLRNDMDSFATVFVGESPWTPLVQQAVESYCARVGLHSTLVEPLFFTCWMHRALREATRAQPQRPRNGRFFATLQHCIAHREAPGLDRLLRQPAAI